VNLRNLLFGPGPVPELKKGAIHVWQISTALEPGFTGELRKIMSPEECERAGRFFFERDRRAFSVCRGLLRILLGLYTQEPASGIEFTFGPQGKPALKTPTSDVRFNVSHSGELAMLAFALGRDIGLDVEIKRSDVDFADLARSSFSPAERFAVTALPAHEQARLFYEYWTCKEACIKADGRGMSVPLDRFSIIPVSGSPWRRAIEVDQDPVLSASMQIRILPCEPNHAAAVASVGTDWDVEHIIVESGTTEQ